MCCQVPQLFDLFVNVISKEEFVSEVLDDSSNAVLWHSSQVGKHLQSLSTRHLFNGRIKLGTIAKTALNGFHILTDTESIEESIAKRGVDIASQHLESGRLSGSIDSQQTKAFASTYAQTQVIHSLQSLVVIFHQIPTTKNLVRKLFKI